MQKSPTVFNRYKQLAKAERFAAAYEAYAKANPTEDEKIAQRKAESAKRLAALKLEEEKLVLGDSSIGLEWDAQGDSLDSFGLKARADITDAIYAATGKDEDFRKQRERDLQAEIYEADKARIAKVANGRPINNLTGKYFDDARAPYDDVASRAKELKLMNIIEAGKQPGINKAYLDQTKQELELLLEQRRRLNPVEIKQGEQSLGDRVRSRLQDKPVVHPPKQEQIDPARIGTAGSADHEASREVFDTVQRKRALSEQYGTQRNDGLYGGTKYYLEQAAKAAPLMATGMAASVVGSPALGAAVMFGGVAAPEYGERRNRGGSIESAIGGASLKGAAEGIGQYISGGALGTLRQAGSLAGRSATSRGGRAGIAVAGEVIGEDVTELINIGTDIVYDGKKVTVDEGVKRLIDAGVIAVAMSGPTSAPVAYFAHPPVTPKEAAENEAIIRQVMEAGENPGFGDGAEAASDIVPDLGQGGQAAAPPEPVSATSETAIPDVIDPIAQQEEAVVVELQNKAAAAESLAQATGSPVAIERAEKARAAATRAGVTMRAARVRKQSELKAKPTAKPKIETIAPESAYDAAQSGEVVAPAQIKSVEEISAEPETLAPIEPIQPTESVDDFVFDPYAQDAEIQASLTLGNRGAEIGFESELDYKGPRAKPPVDYLPAQPALSATSAPETSREGLVKAREDARLAAEAGSVALNESKNYTIDTRNQNWSAFNAADAQLKAFDKSQGQKVTQADSAIKQANTPEFKKWFGDSKVVDAEGNPLVVYHGTNKSEDGKPFTVFDVYGSDYGLFGQGAYFTDDMSVAKEYTSKGKGSTPSVYSVALSIKNPIDMDAKANPQVWLNAFPDLELDTYHEGLDTNESWYRAAEGSLRDKRVPKFEGAEAIQDGLRRMGFDGITHIGGGRVKSEGKRHRVFIAFEPEQIKSADNNNGQFDQNNPNIEYSRAAPTYLEGLTELGSRKDAFSTAIPKGNTVDEMARSVFPKARTFALAPQKGVPATGITIPEIGETAYIFESPYKVWIDVSELQSGQGGEAIYRIASARAKATGKRFVPDPNGMSEIAKARRPETILSEGVKHGNFDFLEPGDQVANYSGDQEQKATALAEQNIKTVVAAYPEMADIVTDGEQFVNANTGEVITDAKFDAIASREPSQNVPEGYRAGRRTLKRAAFLNTFSPGRRETFGVAALAKLRQRQGNDLPKPLQKFLYSRAGDSVTGAARERIAKAFDRAFGAGSFGRAIASGRVNLHDSTSELPGTPDNAQGAYEHAYEGGGDVIHLFANNINENNVAGVLLHEYTHRGFEESVGGLQEANKIYDVMRNIAKRDAELKAAYDRAAAQVGTKNQNDLAREMLAYFLETRQNKGVPDGLFTAIANGVRKGLRAIGIKLKESDSEFKSKVMTIARKSLNSQIDADSRSSSAAPKIEYSTAEQVNTERRASGSAALNPQIRTTNFDGFDISRGKIKSLKAALIDRTRFLKEIKNWQIVKGTYSAATDLHRKLNTYKDAMAGKTFGLKARQQEFIHRIKEEGRDGQDFTAKDVGRWAALNMRDAEMKLGKPNTTGISDASAASQRQRLEPFKDKLDSLAKVITDNHLEALDIRKNLLTQEQYEERLKNPDFVELRGYDNEALQGRLENAVPGVYGLNVAGQEYKAQRSRSGEPKYEDIIAYSFVDIEQAHMRTSWNEVALTIARFAIANPGNPFVQFHPATKITVRNEITGLDEVHHEQPALNKEYINFKHKGIPYSIKMTNERFIEAINSTSKEKGIIEKALGPVMGKFQGAVLKTANFLVIQKLRDAQEISLYLSLHFGPKVAAQALGLHVEAWGAFKRAMDGKPDLNNPTDVALKKWLDGGGLTQIAAPETVDAITKRIKNNLTPLGFTEGAADVVEALTKWEGGFKGAKDAVGAMLDSAEASFNQSKAALIGQQLEKYQTIGENIGRFTAYQAIMAANPNMNSDTAIWHSKESGANFSVRGSLAGTIGAVLPFYNAIAAGLLSNKNYFNNVRKNKKALAAFGAVVGIAVAVGMGNADDEDEDGNSKFLNLTATERAGNFIFIWDGEVIKWPIPQGAVAAINMVAQSVGPMARLIAEGDEKGKERLYEDIWKGVLKNMGPDVGMTGEVDLGPWSSAVQAIQDKDEFGNNIEFKPEDEKWFEDYRSARAEHFLENFIPGYTKELYKTGYAAVNANIRNDSMGSAYAVDKALEDVRGLPLFKIFLASASGKSQASKRILYDVKTAIDEEKADIKKVRNLEGVDVARDELEASELLGESTMSRSGAITVRGDNMAGRAAEQLKEVKRLRALKKRWYNGKDEFNDDLLDATSDIVNISDINTDNFSHYRKMVMEKLKVEENRIFAEYKE